MSDRLHQLNFEYVLDEDRILMRMSTRAGIGCRFWLSRRYTQLLWKALESGMEHQPEVATQAAPQAREAVKAFQKESALKTSNFSTKYDEAELSFPMGETPVLLTRVQTRVGKDKALKLVLMDRDGRSISLNLDAKLLYSWCHLLRRTVAKTDWGLTLHLPEDLAAAGETATAQVH